MMAASAVQVKRQENKTRQEGKREINGEDLQLRHNVNTKKDTRPRTRLLVLTIFFGALFSPLFSFPFRLLKSLRIRMRFAVRAIFLPKMVDRLNLSLSLFYFLQKKQDYIERERLYTRKDLGVGGEKLASFGPDLKPVIKVASSNGFRDGAPR